MAAIIAKCRIGLTQPSSPFIASTMDSLLIETPTIECKSSTHSTFQCRKIILTAKFSLSSVSLKGSASDQNREYSSHVSRLELAEMQPSLATVFKIARALDIAPGDLVAMVDREIN